MSDTLIASGVVTVYPRVRRRQQCSGTFTAGDLGGRGELPVLSRQLRWKLKPALKIQSARVFRKPLLQVLCSRPPRCPRSAPWKVVGVTGEGLRAADGSTVAPRRVAGAERSAQDCACAVVKAPSPTAPGDGTWSDVIPSTRREGAAAHVPHRGGKRFVTRQQVARTTRTRRTRERRPVGGRLRRRGSRGPAHAPWAFS